MHVRACVWVCCRCEWILGQGGDVKRFSVADRDQLVRNVIEPMASDGLRTICLAYKNFLTGKTIISFIAFLLTPH